MEVAVLEVAFLEAAALEAAALEAAVIIRRDTGFVNVGKNAESFRKTWENAGGANINGAKRGAAIGKAKKTTSTDEGTLIIEVSHVLYLFSSNLSTCDSLILIMLMFFE